MDRLTTSDLIAEALIANGVDTVFGIPGAHMYEFNDAVGRRGDCLRTIITRHEQGAGYMAYGYAKATGRVGAYTVVPGPGVLNSGAALCTAFGANAPVLCITGNIMADLIGKGRGQLHELTDQLALLRGLTKWSERINHPSEAPEVMTQAFRQLLSGRQRPVAIEAPWDVLGQRAAVAPPARAVPIPAPVADEAALDAAVELILASRRPLISVGAGALHASDTVRELAELLQAPVAAHRSGKGIVGDDHPLGLAPIAAYEYWRTTDLLIGIGSRTELEFMRWRWRPPGLKTIRIDIDPVEFVRLRPDVGLLADSEAAARALIERLRARIGRRAPVHDEMESLKAMQRGKLATLQPQMAYIDVIRAVLPRDGFFVEELSQIGFTARLGFPTYQPRQYVTCGYQDNLGFGFNTALGVKVAHPGRAVVSVAGDGGFLFGLQELATAVQFGIGVVSLVFNNGGFGNVLRDQRERFAGRVYGAMLHNPDFVRLAEAFGVAAEAVDTPDALRPALERALAAGAPRLIEVRMPAGCETSPWPFLAPKPHGKVTDASTSEPGR